MAKITVTGEALVVTLRVSLENLQRVAKYRPEALKLKDENGDPIYSISVKGTPGINDFGATFGAATYDENKYAAITMKVNPGDQDIKEYIADTYGAAINYLGEIEEKLPGVITEINEERERIKEGIVLA